MAVSAAAVIRSFQKKKDLTFGAAVFLSAVSAMILYAGYLTGRSSFLYATSDGLAIELSNITNAARVFRRFFSSGEISFWSFSVGLGASYSPFYFLFPTNLIPLLFDLFAGEKAMMISFAWMQVIKMTLSSAFLYVFLRKIHFLPAACFTGAYLYSLCGCIVTRGFWPALGDEVWMAALLLLCVEGYFRENRWQGIPVCFVLIAWRTDIYHIYLYSLLLMLYTVFRCIHGRKPFRKSLVFLLKSACYVLLGIGLYAFVILGFGVGLLGSARNSGAQGSSGRWIVGGSVILDALSSILGPSLTGAFQNYSGPLNLLERPLLFSGILSVFMVPQALYFGNRREKKAVLSGIGASCIYLIFPAVTDVFNAFIQNVELQQRSYRLSSLWILLVLTVTCAFGVQCVIRNGRANRALLAVSALLTGAVLAVFLLSGEASGFSIDKKAAVIAAGMTVLWAIVFFRTASKNRRRFTRGFLRIFAVCIAADMIAGNAGTIRASVDEASATASAVYDQNRGYYEGDDFAQAISYVLEKDDGLFRISRKKDDTLPTVKCRAPLYYGISDSCYYTNIDENTYRFLKNICPEAFDELNMGTKYSGGTGEDLCVSTLLGYRYRLFWQDEEGDTSAPDGYEYLASFGHVSVYRLKHALSFGISFDSFIRESDFQKLGEDEKKMVVLKCVVLGDDQKTSLKEISKGELKKICSGADSFREYEKLAGEREESGLMDVAHWSEDEISGTVNLSSDGELLFSIPASDGWTITVDGKKVSAETVDFGLTGISVSAGKHEIRLTYRPSLLTFGEVISLISLAVYLILMILGSKRGKKTGFLSISHRLNEQRGGRTIEPGNTTSGHPVS